VYVCVCLCVCLMLGFWVTNRNVKQQKLDNGQDLMLQSLLLSQYFQKDILERAHSLKLLFRVPQGPQCITVDQGRAYL
jgi:hypothetical protein